MSLTITAVKRFKPESGVRKGIVDITFDTGGPSWTVTAAMFKINGLWNLRIQPVVDGYLLSFKASTLAIEGWEEQDGGSALQALDAGDLSTKVVRAEYVGW